MSRRLDRLAGALVFTLVLVPGPGSAQRGGCVGDEADGSEVVVAGADEPGERLVVNGRVLAADGAPIPGVRVRVFHTDDEGYYSEGGMDEANARLCGVLETGADGSYRIRTILPARYATGGPEPHIHFVATLPDGARRSFTLQWTEAREGTDPASGERSASVRPLVQGDDGVLRLVYDLVLERS